MDERAVVNLAAVSGSNLGFFALPQLVLLQFYNDRVNSNLLLPMFLFVSRQYLGLCSVNF